ncbi:hypothetical protein MA9V2_008 [Chryseobacterium phage MA9V-2]|nr:hypothetical protein MA9V2_008 [Chryseobacterium phage MA9V-2]
MQNTQQEDNVVDVQIDSKELLNELEQLTGQRIVSEEYQKDQAQLLEYMEQNKLYGRSTMNRQQKRNHFLKADLGGDKSNQQRAQAKKVAKVKAKSKAAKKARKKQR